MRTRPVAAALLIALAPATVAAPAYGESSAEDPTTAMARLRFKEGVEFYDKGQFEQARAAFLQAYALKKHPAVLLNLAWSCLKSGHTLEGERYFKQFLVEGKDITDKQRADANDGLNQSHAKLGRIEVSAPSGTEVTIDGDKAGTVPLAEPAVVEAGAHVVKLKGPDGTTDTESVTVLGGEKAVARFAKAGAAAPVPPAPAPAAPPSENETPATAPPPEETHKAAEHGTRKESAGVEAHRSDLLAPPENLVPVVVGGVLTLGGLAVAITMLVSKGSAQSKADATTTNIQNNHGTRCNPPAFDSTVDTNSSQYPALLAELQNSCKSLVSDYNDVNTDATVGNIAIGVGLAALAGTVLYWLVADKKGDADHSAASLPKVVPFVGPSASGLSLFGGF
jgi:hypothetical protein